MSAKPKYFCENCGSEVAANARVCPKCGKFFASVRCPRCGHLGTVQDFKKGCPSCHYAMTKEDIFGKEESLEEKTKPKKKKKSAKKNQKSKASILNLADEAAPTWMYVASVILLILTLALLFYRCQ